MSSKDDNRSTTVRTMAEAMFDHIGHRPEDFKGDGAIQDLWEGCSVPIKDYLRGCTGQALGILVAYVSNAAYETSAEDISIGMILGEKWPDPSSETGEVLIDLAAASMVVVMVNLK